MKNIFKIGFIGYGNMSCAILNGINKSQSIASETICVYDIDDSKKELAESFGYHFATSTNEVFDSCEYIFLCIKPQFFDSMAETVSNKEGSYKLISIMAGKNIAQIKSHFSNSKVLRTMPNTPCLIGKGVVAICRNDFNNEEFEFAKSIFDTCAETYETMESEINKIIVASGSAPAYTFLFADYLTQKCTEIGLESKLAKELTLNTIIGACELAKTSEESLATLCERVCSKGGTTIEAVKTMENSNMKEIIFEALQNCFDRANELTGDKQ
ncbi:MAG: pyrroline-5-carboxylate reductase [Bacillota bacterium]